MHKILPSILLVLSSITAQAQVPDHYYDAAAGKSCGPLKSALKKIITSGSVAKSYDALYDQYKKSDVKPREVGSGSANVIWDIYSDVPNAKDPYNFDPGTDECGSYNSEADCFNREHTVPQSWFNSASTPGSDYNIIYPTDGYVNNRRSNYLYGEVASATWTSKNGSKLGSSAVAGISGTVFEPIDTYKGDLARAFFYFVTRYQDNIPGWSSNSAAFSHDTFPSINIFYLTMMLKWNDEDPVSQKEIDRNNAAYTYQHNRNPYIDHPEYVDQVWNSSCPGLGTLPVDIIYFTGKLSGNNILLTWKTANEINLSGYSIEKSFNGIHYTQIGEIKTNGTQDYSFNDNIANERGNNIFYRLKKINKDGTSSYSEVYSIHVPFNNIFSVYPNPAKNYVTVQLMQNNVSAQIVICDLSGKILINQNSKTAANIIPVSTLSNGCYFIKILMNGEQFVQKLIVTK